MIDTPERGISIRALKEVPHFIPIRKGFENMLTCGERIKELRRQKRISQTELAEIAGVKKNTVSTWERDTRRPDQHALKKLAEYFGVSWEYILGEGSDTQTSLTVQNEMCDVSPSNRMQEMFVRWSMLDPLSQAIIEAAVNEAYKKNIEDGILQPKKYDITISER